MIRTLVGISFVTMLATTTAGATMVELRPAEEKRPGDGPYLPAQLTVRADVPVSAVALRPKSGGLSLRYELAAPPGEPARRRILLPAGGIQQDYDIRVYPADGSSPMSAEAEITWPVEWVDTWAMVRPSLYGDVEPPNWSAGERRGLFLLAAVFAVAASAAVLLPRSWMRTAGVLVPIVAATAVFFAVRPEAVETRIREDALILKARRSTRILRGGAYEELAGRLGGYWPVYASPGQMKRDTMRIAPGHDAKLFLPAGGTRVFLPHVSTKATGS